MGAAQSASVILHVIESRAPQDSAASNSDRMAWNFLNGSEVFDLGIQPQVVLVGSDDDWHPVMMLEDKTGTSRVIISPDFYDKARMAVLKERFVLVSGLVQNQATVVHLKARRIEPLTITASATLSHDFH